MSGSVRFNEPATVFDKPPPASGVSFAHMARMGYAATGPALGSGNATPRYCYRTLTHVHVN